MNERKPTKPKIQLKKNFFSLLYLSQKLFDSYFSTQKRYKSEEHQTWIPKI
jgi:hypothetical protein